MNTFMGLNFFKYIWSDDSWQNNTVLYSECKDTIPVEKLSVILSDVSLYFKF